MFATRPSPACLPLRCPSVSPEGSSLVLPPSSSLTSLGAVSSLLTCSLQDFHFSFLAECLTALEAPTAVGAIVLQQNWNRSSSSFVLKQHRFRCRQPFSHYRSQSTGPRAHSFHRSVMPRPSAAYVHTDTYAYTNSTSTTLYTNELTPAATTTTTWPSSTTSPPLRSRNRRNSHSQSHSYTYQFNKSQAKHKRRRSTCEPPRNAKSHSRKRARTLTDSATGVGLVCRRTKRRRMDSALPSPSPTPPPRDTWAQYHQAVADGGIVMLSPADLSAYNPSSYAHRRECEAMDALWARPFDVRRLAKRWAGGVERASRQPDAVQRLSMRGCLTERADEGSSFEEEDELAAVQQLRVGEEEAEEAHSVIESESEVFVPPSEPAEPKPPPEGPFWFAPPLVARYSRGAPYTLQRCRARQALSDLLRSPFDNRHFRLDE